MPCRRRVRKWQHTGSHLETYMSKSHRTDDAQTLNPRAIKRRRQWEALVKPGREPLLFPLPDPPAWKPLG